MDIKEKSLVTFKLQFLTEVLKEYSENENFLSYFP